MCNPKLNSQESIINPSQIGSLLPLELLDSYSKREQPQFPLLLCFCKLCFEQRVQISECLKPNLFVSYNPVVCDSDFLSSCMGRWGYPLYRGYLPFSGNTRMRVLSDGNTCALRRRSCRVTSYLHNFTFPIRSGPSHSYLLISLLDYKVGSTLGATGL